MLNLNNKFKFEVNILFINIVIKSIKILIYG